MSFHLSVTLWEKLNFLLSYVLLTIRRFKSRWGYTVLSFSLTLASQRERETAFHLSITLLGKMNVLFFQYFLTYLWVKIILVFPYTFSLMSSKIRQAKG